MVPDWCQLVSVCVRQWCHIGVSQCNTGVIWCLGAEPGADVDHRRGVAGPGRGARPRGQDQSLQALPASSH